MTLTIDTENKTVSFNSTIQIGDLITELKKLFPKDWKEYQLIAVNYTYYPQYPQVYPAYETPIITTGSTVYLTDN